MTIHTTIHLNFRGQARAALDYYRSVFGGETAITTYGEVGMPADAPDAQRVVFGQLIDEDGVALMAYDIPGATGETIAGGGSTTRSNGVTITDQAFFVALSGETIEDVQTYWRALAEDATIVEPLAASAWSAGFGMLTDRFGVTWSMSVTPTDAP
jgi:PhnB protein